jgi:hypothetical protein
MRRKLSGVILLTILCGILIVGSFDPTNFGLSPDAKYVATLHPAWYATFPLYPMPDDFGPPLHSDAALLRMALTIGALVMLYSVLPQRTVSSPPVGHISYVWLLKASPGTRHRRNIRLPKDQRRYAL